MSRTYFFLLMLFGLFGFGYGYGAEHQPLDVQPSETPGPAAPLGQSGRWTLVFSDEFEGDALDTDKWTTCYWWDDAWDNEGCTNEGNNELQWYRPENVTVEGGNLVLRAQEERVRVSDGNSRGETYDYTSGMITTGRDTHDLSAEPRATFKHVYVEVKANMPSGRGLWPALWLLPVDHDARPEIDIMEVLGHNPRNAHMNFHFLDEQGDYQRADHSWRSPKPLTGWQVFAVDWQPQGVTWYINGTKRAHFAGDKAYVPDEPMYLIANLAVGGDWPGSPNADTPFPSSFEIDYVRVWMRD